MSAGQRLRRTAVLIVLDGAADRPEPSLDGQTPLELARTPFLDAIAKRSGGQMVQVLPNAGAPQTHSGMLSLLGYPEVATQARRGCLEASVVFDGMRPGCIYARGNLSSLVDGRIPSRRVNRDISQAEADRVCEVLNLRVPPAVSIRCRFESYSTYRLAVEIELGANASQAISGTDPGYAANDYATPVAQDDFVPCFSRPLDSSPAATSTSRAVNAIAEACFHALDQEPLNSARTHAGRLPVNYVLMRDFGVSLPAVERFGERWGVRAKYFHDLPVEQGVARYLAMDHAEADCASVSVEAFEAAGRRLISDTRRYGFICFHVKGPDEPGHDGDWRGKVQAIETVDQGLFPALLAAVEAASINVAVTSDHATCWALGTHTSDEVPLVLSGSTGGVVGRFTERACASGSLGIRRAWELMPQLLQSAARRYD